MIDNIYELENGRQYVVVAEKTIDNKRYVLVSECNYEKDEINTDEILIKHVIVKEDSVYFDNVDEDTAKVILPKLLEN